MSDEEKNNSSEDDGKSRDFLREEIDKDLAESRYDGVVTRFPPEPNAYMTIGNAKAICINFGIAEEYGGMGGDWVSLHVVIEELSRADANFGALLDVTTSVVGQELFVFGTEEQKQKYLVPIASGEKMKRDERKRETALRKEHGREWLGPLEPVAALVLPAAGCAAEAGIPLTQALPGLLPARSVCSRR